MRALLALVAGVLLVPTGPAQVALLEDPGGDVTVTAAGTGGPATASHGSIDLLGLDLVEELDLLQFKVHLGDVGDGAQDPSPDGTVCFLFLAHNGRQFLAVASRSFPVLGGHVTFTPFYTRDDDAADWERRPEAETTASVDAATDVLTYVVPRTDLVDAQGAAPYPGRSLEGIRLQCDSGSLHTSIVGGDLPVPAGAFDAMPDDASQAATYAIQLGAAQSGHALLTSPEPFRFSNGEATTFVYEVTLHNLAGHDDTFTLQARNVPRDVSVQVAEPRPALPAGSSQTLQVKVSVPFFHEHGATHSFLLEAASTTDTASVGRIEMGVRYLTVPQPAGHHDTLYVHSARQGGPDEPVAEQAPGIVGTDGYLNTMQDDPDDGGLPIAFSGTASIVGSTGFDFTVSLRPALLMGLDVDLDRTGEAEVSIGSRTPLQTATLSATVLVSAPDGPIELARMDAVPIGSSSQDTYTFKGTLVPNPQADRIPYLKGQNLYLDLHFTNTDPNGAIGADPPYLLTGSRIRLPLQDYHDEVGAGDEPLGAELVQDPSSQAPPQQSPGLAAGAMVSLLALAFLRRRLD